eukprot:scaffold414_cov85-Skeletonema_marinoi.AAC.1
MTSSEGSSEQKDEHIDDDRKISEERNRNKYLCRDRIIKCVKGVTTTKRSEADVNYQKCGDIWGNTP